MNLRKPQKHTVRIALLVTAGFLTAVSSAAAVIYIYKNGFNSRASYKEIEHIGGGKKCDKDFLEESDSMRIQLAGREFCEYAPPVAADRKQPDHEILVQGKITKSTPKNVRQQSYLAVRVRVGNQTYYELRIHPKTQEYRLKREPPANDLPPKETSPHIEKIDENNSILLRVNGTRVRAFVNGQPLGQAYEDANAEEVEGRRVSFGLGNTKDSGDGPTAIIKSVKVGVPNP